MGTFVLNTPGVKFDCSMSAFGSSCAARIMQYATADIAKDLTKEQAKLFNKLLYLTMYDRGTAAYVCLDNTNEKAYGWRVLCTHPLVGKPWKQSFLNDAYNLHSGHNGGSHINIWAAGNPLTYWEAMTLYHWMLLQYHKAKKPFLAKAEMDEVNYQMEDIPFTKFPSPSKAFRALLAAGFPAAPRPMFAKKYDKDESMFYNCVKASGLREFSNRLLGEPAIPTFQCYVDRPGVTSVDRLNRKYFPEYWGGNAKVANAEVKAAAAKAVVHDEFITWGDADDDPWELEA